MLELVIRWTHLSVDGETCSRCSETGKELAIAVEALRKTLSPLGIRVVFEEVEITNEEFSRNPLRSNEIWLNGKLLEEWLGARTTQTQCCNVCGDEECRALEVDGQLHEVITSELVIKAGLIAASKLISASGCCCSGQPSCCDREPDQQQGFPLPSK
ncbi:MAG: DUF2703 domain-containing protein [Armatimonadota bacterium]|nr:DUF2703 domain-containing protein [Armatimonadota bacterium]MCX7777850.1 DUF2703 domain-containing protein [Armatimonadota bacterium]MDW8025842.1 DUF2703 domain-containing protein [Armatimonadota bacterium]